MTAAALWVAVKAAYETEGLITLSNPRDPSATGVDDTAGESAAQQFIDLFPLYAQRAYDADDSQHVAIGLRGTIAVLFERGGTASTIAEVEWKEVFGDGGLLEQLKRTQGGRGRKGPSSNSGVRQKSELTSNGQRVRGWSDPEALPLGRRYLPRRSIAED